MPPVKWMPPWGRRYRRDGDRSPAKTVTMCAIRYFAAQHRKQRTSFMEQSDQDGAEETQSSVESAQCRLCLVLLIEWYKYCFDRVCPVLAHWHNNGAHFINAWCRHSTRLWAHAGRISYLIYNRIAVNRMEICGINLLIRARLRCSKQVSNFLWF